MANWNTFDDMDTLRREIDRTLQEFGLASEPVLRGAFLPGRGPRRYPLINLKEDKDSVYVEALAPGLDANSLNLTVVHNRLTISGEKPQINGGIKAEAFHRNERASGKFVRMVELPVEVDEAKVNAEYKNGVLTIKLPKAEKARPRQITVEVA